MTQTTKAVRASRSRVASERTAPPPSAMTAVGPASASATTCSSIRRNSGSPRSKSSPIGPKRLLDLLVRVDERTVREVRELAAERRLPRAHEADEREVLVYRADHGMRSR